MPGAWSRDGSYRAAVRDIMNISARRNPYVQLIFICQVQEKRCESVPGEFTCWSARAWM